MKSPADFSWKTIQTNEYLRLRQTMQKLDTLLNGTQWTLADIKEAARLVQRGLIKPAPGEKP